LDDYAPDDPKMDARSVRDVVACIAPLRTGANHPLFLSLRPSPELLLPATESKGGVRAELLQLQAKDGLTIGWLEHNGPQIVKFDKRSVIRGGRLTDQFVGRGAISPDGTQIAVTSHRATGHVLPLGIIQPDDANLRQFANMEKSVPTGWSYDMSRLAILVLDTQQSRLSLEDLDWGSQSVTRIAVLTSPSEVSTQCWSPDGTAIVFETDGHVTVQKLDESKPTTLAVGTTPTWSPDGNWIAYLDKNEQSYYVIHPAGDGNKKLFHSRRGMPGLYCSPDGRIVAYVVEKGFIFMDVETYPFRVRRLEDNSDDWVANEDLGCCENLQWITSKALIARVESESRAKQK
jgi:hypothetical protein